MFRRILYPLLILTLLSGCGGAEDETGATETHSKTLLDSPISAQASFENFDLSIVTIDPSLFPLMGERLFLRLTLSNGALLFLGEISRHQTVEIPINVSIDNNTVHYEVFSDFPEDKTVYGEITL